MNDILIAIALIVGTPVATGVATYVVLQLLDWPERRRIRKHWEALEAHSNAESARRYAEFKAWQALMHSPKPDQPKDPSNG